MIPNHNTPNPPNPIPNPPQQKTHIVILSKSPGPLPDFLVTSLGVWQSSQWLVVKDRPFCIYWPPYDINFINYKGIKNVPCDYKDETLNLKPPFLLQNALKLTYNKVALKNIFRGSAPGPPGPRLTARKGVSYAEGEGPLTWNA